MCYDQLKSKIYPVLYHGNSKKESMEEYIRNITKGKKLIGIGSGNTVSSIIQYLPTTHCDYTATSFTIELLLKQRGLNVVPLHTISHLDLYIDGTDFYDSKNNLLKGGGGCILNEKICIQMSKETHILAQKSKLRNSFDGCTVVYEVVKSCASYFTQYCKIIDLKCTLRYNLGRFGIYTTEHGNLLFDLDFIAYINTDINNITGVMCHGFVDSTKYKFSIFEIN